MSTPCTITQSNGLAVLGKPAPSHISDPIFRPRRRPYNSEELKYIWSLAPFAVLPPILRRTRTNRSPPLMHFGWIIDDESEARLMEKAHEARCYLMYDEVLLEEEDCGPGSEPRVFKVQGPVPIHKLGTLEMAGELVFSELNIKFSGSQTVTLMGAPIDQDVYFFSLFTNHDLDKTLSSQEEIQTIQKRLSFKGKPAWWPSDDFSWIPLY
ncbi:hypothetical protein EIP86_005185 [Pleurotus ostreatoroseus]|nr:hypothetical protein EIP86_005185 [Pleurotus ostreatoroseus]